MTQTRCYCGRPTDREDGICGECISWVGITTTREIHIHRKKILASMPTTKLDIQTIEEKKNDK